MKIGCPNHKITTFNVRMRGVGTEARTTGVPTKVMKLVSYCEIRLSNDPSVICGLGSKSTTAMASGRFRVGSKLAT